jgi:hypothetical protein
MVIPSFPDFLPRARSILLPSPGALLPSLRPVRIAVVQSLDSDLGKHEQFLKPRSPVVGAGEGRGVVTC